MADWPAPRAIWIDPPCFETGDVPVEISPDAVEATLSQPVRYVRADAVLEGPRVAVLIEAAKEVADVGSLEDWERRCRSSITRLMDYEDIERLRAALAAFEAEDPSDGR